MDDLNISMEEYIRLEEEKAHRHGKVYNWETATYGKIWCDEDVHDLRSVETEFPAIFYNDALTYEVALSCEPTVSPLNDNQIDFRILLDESEDEDYTVMAALVIPISSDSSEESVDPSEDSLPLAPKLPLVSPFLCFNDSKANSESEPAEQRPERHESLTPSYEFPLAPVVALPWIRRRLAILVRPGEAIPFGRPYRTHPNRPRKLLTVRKRVGPFLARRLAWRCISHRSLDRHSSPDFTSDSSSSSSSSDSSSDISSGSSSDSLSDSSSVHSSGYGASPRLVYPSVIGFIFTFCWTISKSLTTLVPSSTPVPRSIASTHVDLLPPLKRFRDSYSSEDSGEEHMEIGSADVETVADLGINDRVRAHTEDGIGIGVEVATSDIREDEEEFEVEANAGGTTEIAVDPLVTGGISKPAGVDAPDLEGERASLADRFRSLGRENLRVRALLCIERDHFDSLRRHMALSQEEFHQLHKDRDDTQGRLIRTMTNTGYEMTPTAIQEMINRRVVEALGTREANKNIRLGKGNDEGGNGNGNGNGNGGGNENGNHNENDKDARPVVREYTY
ncbi:hypothetical protein Tco_0138172 [Tanacetum coccineum]